MRRELRIILITAVSFGLYFILDALYFNAIRKWLFENIKQFGISHILAYSIFGLLLILATALMHKVSGVIDSLGLNGSIIKGFLFSFICTMPMFIGYAAAFDFSQEITPDNILIKVIAAAFFEELYFRAFLFGQIYRYTRLGFFPSIVFGAFLFAFIHLYQSQDLSTLVGVFLTTFLGAVLFAWAYVEWQYNIWVPIFLHLLMNLFWLMFSVSDNAFGGIYANIFRTLSLILIIVLTIIYKRRKNIPFEINKKTIWLKKDEILE